MKIITLILVYISISFAVMAQADLCVKIEQQPSDWAPFLKKKKNHQIKKQIFLVSSLNSGHIRDTLSIEYYNPQGDLIRKIGFSDRNGKSISTYETSKDTKVIKWRSDRLKEKTASFNINTFHANGNPARFRSAEINSKGDTVLRGLVTFTYNSKQQLLERTQQANGIITGKQTYTYVGNDIVKHTTGSAGSIWYEYIYNAEHLPIKKVEHQSGTWGTAIIKTNTYNYQNGLLATESYTNADLDKKDVEVTYTYDSQGRVKSFRAVRDTLFREVSFEFSGELLKQINIKGNTARWFTQEYFINIGQPYSEKHEPIVYQRDFEYDNKGNLIRDTQFLNEIKYMQMDYHLEYY